MMDEWYIDGLWINDGWLIEEWLLDMDEWIMDQWWINIGFTVDEWWMNVESIMDKRCMDGSWACLLGWLIPRSAHLK
jgi:hypothetical protein